MSPAVPLSELSHIHLHDDEGDTAEVYGGLECGDGLGVGQPVQTGVVHLKQQVALLYVGVDFRQYSSKYCSFQMNGGGISVRYRCL